MEVEQVRDGGRGKRVEVEKETGEGWTKLW